MNEGRQGDMGEEAIVPIDDGLMEELLAAYKKRERTKRIVIGAVVFFALGVWFMVQPLRGGTEYGICRTYLETYVRYPTTLDLTQYDVFGRSIRIFFTHRDPFGQSRSEMIECLAVPDPDQKIVMQDIKLNRQPIDRERLKTFNLSIPAILAGHPDLIIPIIKDTEDIKNLRKD